MFHVICCYICPKKLWKEPFALFMVEEICISFYYLFLQNLIWKQVCKKARLGNWPDLSRKIRYWVGSDLIKIRSKPGATNLQSWPKPDLILSCLPKVSEHVWERERERLINKLYLNWWGNMFICHLIFIPFERLPKPPSWVIHSAMRRKSLHLRLDA